jgi:hypothetical protein
VRKKIAKDAKELAKVRVVQLVRPKAKALAETKVKARMLEERRRSRKQLKKR